MREDFASYSFLAATVAGLVLLCFGLLTIALSSTRPDDAFAQPTSGLQQMK
jgi:hypothetical protein